MKPEDANGNGDDDVIAVVYPVVRDGRIVPITDNVPRGEVLRRLDGLPILDQVGLDRDLRVITLLDRTALASWISAEEMAALRLADPGFFG
jgi:hypothetical protein